MLAPVYLLLLIEPEQFVGGDCDTGFRDRRPLRELGRGLSIAGYTDGLAESKAVASDNRQALSGAGRTDIEQIVRHALGGDDLIIDRLALASVCGDGVPVGELAIVCREVTPILERDAVLGDAGNCNEFAVSRLETLDAPVCLKE